MIELTGNIENKIRRVDSALADTQRYIDRESARADDLRPAATQELLDKYIAHKAKLEATLEALITARIKELHAAI
jgi:hypothetical protein